MNQRSTSISRSIFVALLGLLLLTAFLPPPSEVVDLVTGEAVEADLRPIDPWVLWATEPVTGPLFALFGTSVRRIAVWVLWCATIFVTLRASRAAWRGRRLRGIATETSSFIGTSCLLALVPVPLYWFGVISKDVRKLLTPYGLPLVVLVLIVLRAWWRTPKGSKRAAILERLRRFFGVLGTVYVVILLLAYSIPGVDHAGRRLELDESWYAVDLHAHSDRLRDSVIGPADRLRFFDEHRIRISAVTEHNYVSVGPSRPDPEDHRAVARREGLDMLLISGEEFTTPVGHLVLLGIDRNYFPWDYLREEDPSKLGPPDFGYDFTRLIREVHEEGGRVVAAHWWADAGPRRVDWRDLVEWGVDGFEIGWRGERAPEHLVRAWNAADLLLVATNDYHGHRKSLYSWNLIPARAVNPEGLPLGDLDPQTVLDRFFSRRELRPVGLWIHRRGAPDWLAPPVDLWSYARSLDPLRRSSWIFFVCAVWGSLEIRRARASFGI